MLDITLLRKDLDAEASQSASRFPVTAAKKRETASKVRTDLQALTVAGAVVVEGREVSLPRLHRSRRWPRAASVRYFGSEAPFSVPS
mgnify:CR=1 FL=1